MLLESPQCVSYARGMLDEDPEIEISPLSGKITRDGVTVEVLIYRIAGEDADWTLEVVDQDDASTVWDDTFPTDKDAYAAFYRTLEIEGIRSFLEQPPAPTKH